MQRFVLLASLFIAVTYTSQSFALDRCNYESPNNVFTPTADVTKDDVCSFSEIMNYKNLFYFSGPKAICADKKEAYCAKAAEKINGSDAIHLPDAAMPTEKIYWVQAAKLCGIDYQAKLENDCAKYAKEGSSNGSYYFELACKAEHVQTFANRQCGGRAYTTGSSSSDRAFCGRNFKGKQDPRFKLDAKDKNSKPVFSDGKYLTKACEPELTLQHAQYLKKNASSSSSTSNSSTSSSSSSANSNSSSNSNSNGSNSPAPTSAPKAPDTVDDALNKAKKLKDVFGF